jgi:aminopeptidase N
MTRTVWRSTALAAVLAAAALPGAAQTARAPAGAPAGAAREILPVTATPVRQLISVTPDIAARTFRGQTRITIDVARPTSRIVLNQADLTFDRAVLVGREGIPARIAADARQTVTLTFDQPIAPGRHTLLIDYAGKIGQSAAGLFASEYTQGGARKVMLATQMEPGDARRLAPMWDEPAIKTIWEVEAVVPQGLDVVSNMPAASTTAAGAGLKRVRFQPSPKMSSYLLFLGVGEFDRISAPIAGTEMGVIAKRGDAEKGRYALQAAAQVTGYFNDYFGTPYPLPKMDHIAVPGAGGFGAMENWGAILYFEPYLLLDPALSTESDRRNVYEIVAHETAHQWFGNLVTMSWWDDLWLNEGFASWMETKTTDHFNPRWEVWLQASGGKESAMALDARASTHPVVQEVRDVEQATLAFDTITYQKGQAVIRMLESYIGEDPFRTGVRAYMKRHAYANTQTSDLWRELDRAAPNTPVSAIARDFTTQPGVPLITVERVACQGGRTVVSLRQGRFGVDAPSKRPLTWRTPVVVGKVRSTGGPITGRTVVEGSGRVTLDGCGEPIVVNAGQTGYFRTAYGDAEFERLRTDFNRLADVDQLGLMQDSAALGRAGYASFARYLDLTRQVNAATDPIIQASVVGSLTGLDGLYEPGAERDRYRAYARGVIAPIFARVGWTVQPGESDNTALLRTTLIGALSRLGDPATAAEARRRYAANDVPPALRRAVIGVVGYNADAAAWDALRAQAAAASSQQEQRLYLGAMAATPDPALAQRMLALTLTEAVPGQLAPGLIRSVAGQHPDLAWNFYMANRAAVDARLDPLQRLDFAAGLASAGGGLRRAEELQRFAEANIPAGSRAASDQAISAIRYGTEVRARIRPEVDRWLASQTQRTASR